MSTNATASLTPVAADSTPIAAAATLGRTYRFEMLKQASQWRTRLLVLAAWTVPALVVGVMSRQGALPADTVFGRWMLTSGWAGALVMLGFSSLWALPLLTSVVAGDVFAVEDRLGTWRHLLVAVRSPRKIFMAKAAASLTVLLVLVLGLACSGAAGALAVVGNRPLVGLDGHTLTAAQAAATAALAWVCVLAPALALAAIGLLGSVALGRSPVGLLLPVLVAFGMQIAAMLPLPAAARFALPTYGFTAWRGLFTSPPQVGPVLLASAVSLVWAAAATMLGYRLFLRRDFTSASDERVARNAVTGGVVPLAALGALIAGATVVATPAAGSGIDQTKVERSLATVFAHLYRLQATELHRPDVTEAQLDATASCTKGDGLLDNSGPGNGWRCVVTWHLPGVSATGTAIYQLNVDADGRYTADGDGPKDVNGYFLVRTPTGNASNPLWQFDGIVDLLTRTPKG